MHEVSGRDFSRAEEREKMMSGLQPLGVCMRAEQISWVGWEVPTANATWVCTRSVAKDVGFTSPTTFMVDGIDYFLEFSAHDKKSADIPDTRHLQLRTSPFKISHEPSFLWHFSLVIDGQMLDGAPWDRFKGVYKQD